MRILIIEDQKTIADSLKIGLQHEGFSVDVSYDGLEGYDLASVEEYDVIILDLMLPGLDGMTICKKIRSQGKKTPILMLTAKDALQDKVTGLNSGADDYLNKPFAFDELLARTRSLIRRSHNQNPTLKINSLILDTTGHTVTRLGKELELTAKEYALLEYMMLNQNQVLTRDRILSHVWDYSYEGLSNTVDVMIKRLREKIDKAFPNEKPLISTQRGLGYRIGE
jgi:DNA-binding response OmpR family regulator